MAKNILITGGCGFVGSNLCILMKEKYPHYRIIAMDNLKRRGSELNIPRLKAMEIEFLHADIRNKEDLLIDIPLHTIIDAAAEPSVMAGIGDSSTAYLIATNFNGTVNLLDLAIKHKADFIFLSTSRVYPIASLEQIVYHEENSRFEMDREQLLPGCSVKGISEQFPLTGARSLYGSTKLAAELMIQEYASFMGLQAVINRCGVITGPYQMGKVDQGVVVLWMARHFWKKPVTYIGYGGSGKQVRDLLHIHDLFRLVDMQVHAMADFKGKIFNAGGGVDISVSLKELTNWCARITGNAVPEEMQLQNRSGDIPLYITDNSSIRAATEWQPMKQVEVILTDIFEWIKQNEKQLKPILDQ
jgi:CDP-paratose 2-epimerase